MKLNNIKDCIKYLKETTTKVAGTYTPRKINGQDADYNFFIQATDGNIYNFFTGDLRFMIETTCVIRKVDSVKDYHGCHNFIIHNLQDLKDFFTVYCKAEYYNKRL